MTRTFHHRQAYYDQLADRYDEDRFTHSYGKFIHSLEDKIMKQTLRTNKGSRVLDLGCGTGRFINYASHGVDESLQMLKAAAEKSPATQLCQANSAALPFPDKYFDQVFSWHVFMHLDKHETKQTLSEITRVLKPRGSFLVDFPSAKRRRLVNHHQPNWHGANQFTVSEFQDLAAGKLQTKNVTGLLMLPIHRLPTLLRPYLKSLDTLLGRSPLREYASYLVLELMKP